MRGALVVLVALAALVTTACDDAGGDPAGDDDPVARQWAQREQLRDCGHVTSGAVGSWRELEGESWQCFDAALRRGGGAEVAWTSSTVEGDPIRSWYRAVDGRLEIYTDTTEDTFGPQEWTFVDCRAPDHLPREGWWPECAETG